jgi:quercetin dioxygenase-like cupin family protein
MLMWLTVWCDAVDTCLDLRMAVRTVAALFPAVIESIQTDYWKSSSRSAINGYYCRHFIERRLEETAKNEDKPIGGRRNPMKIRTIIAATCAALAISRAGPIQAHDGEAQTVTKNFEAAIPNIPGKSLVALEVDYAPGAASPSHTHAKSAFIYAYVISGAIESKVNDGETRIYRAGESWSEAPGAIHSISRNASKTQPAKLLAVFVLDTDDRVLTTPIK